MKLAVRRDVEGDPNSASDAEMLSQAQDWEVLGFVAFKGRMDALVFVERRYFHQVSLSIFEGARFAPPEHWRIVTGTMALLRDVDFIVAHEALASDPLFLARCVGMDEEALQRLRDILTA